jgi:hypothetical protein
MWVMSNLISVYLEMVLVLVQDRCTVCPKCRNHFSCTLMLHLGDEAQVEACIGPFGDSANHDARYMLGLHRMYHRLVNHFGRTRLNT